ncbi:MAG: helix-turn-helix domain-containing protein [Treponema sp.]|jgi:transcriptional regulator with XRE-family HTH domain|nr:helix-turn-helix domain-containing protein [Treponema sp.]
MTETENELHEIFSQNLKKIRHDLGFTQIALAKRAGVSTNFINDIEAGKKWASLATMIKIAKITDIHVYELLKPPNLLPDNLNGILRKYVEDVHAAIDHINHDLLESEKLIHRDAITPQEKT